MRNVSDKICRVNRNTRFVSSNFFFFRENRAVCEIMWENIVERCRAQMAIWRMRVACCISKATNTLSEYVTRIAFPLQESLHGRASMLRLIVCHYNLSRCFEDYLSFCIYLTLG
jgi:hypothetical protein